MDKAKGFFNKMGMGGSDTPAANNAGMTETKNRFMGITNTPAPIMSNATAGYLGRWGEVSQRHILLFLHADVVYRTDIQTLPS